MVLGHFVVCCSVSVVMMLISVCAAFNYCVYVV